MYDAQTGLTVRGITRGTAAFDDAERLNREAFPPQEYIPIDKMLLVAEDWGLDLLAYYDGEDFAGFIVVMTTCDTGYVFYFAVEPSLRSRGYGGKILSHIRRRYAEKQMVIDIEAPDESAPNNEQRLRRRAFYLRNGYHATGYYIFYMNTEFEIVCSRPLLDKPAYETLLKGIKVHEFTPRLYRKDEKSPCATE